MSVRLPIPHQHHQPTVPTMPTTLPTAPTRTLSFDGEVGQLQARRLFEITGPGRLLYLITIDGSEGNAGYSIIVDGVSAILAGAQPAGPDVAQIDVDVNNYFFPWLLAEVTAMVPGFPGRNAQTPNSSVRGNTTYLYAGYDTSGGGTVLNQVMIYSAPIVWSNQLAVSVKVFGPAVYVFATLTYVVGGV